MSLVCDRCRASLRNPGALCIGGTPQLQCLVHDNSAVSSAVQITDETDTWEEGGSRRGPRREERGASMSLFDHKVTHRDTLQDELAATRAALWG